MTTCKDLRHNQRVTGSLEIVVYDINDSPVYPREVELNATDADGEELKIVIWKKHDTSVVWNAGATYEITGGRAKRYEDASGPDIRVHSNEDISIDRLDTTSDAIRMLVMGDTHVGYRHRSPTQKPSWAKDVDNRQTFRQSFARARSLDVDAVLHAGDVFDHNTSQGDRNLVGHEINHTHQAGIPIYFVRGNHDNNPGNRILSQSPAVHIGDDPARVGQEPIQVLGLDNGSGGFTNSLPYGTIKSVYDSSILMIHDTPYPALDENGKAIYRKDTDRLDLSGFLDSAASWLDLIVAGHMHVGRLGSIDGYDVPLLVTGPTAPISSYDNESRPSTWLLTLSEGNIGIERQFL